MKIKRILKIPFALLLLCINGFLLAMDMHSQERGWSSKGFNLDEESLHNFIDKYYYHPIEELLKTSFLPKFLEVLIPVAEERYRAIVKKNYGEDLKKIKLTREHVIFDRILFVDTEKRFSDCMDCKYITLAETSMSTSSHTRDLVLYVDQIKKSCKNLSEFMALILHESVHAFMQELEISKSCKFKGKDFKGTFLFMEYEKEFQEAKERAERIQKEKKSKNEKFTLREFLVGFENFTRSVFYKGLDDLDNLPSLCKSTEKGFYFFPSRQRKEEYRSKIGKTLSENLVRKDILDLVRVEDLKGRLKKDQKYFFTHLHESVPSELDKLFKKLEDDCEEYETDIFATLIHKSILVDYISQGLKKKSEEILDVSSDWEGKQKNLKPAVIKEIFLKICNNFPLLRENIHTEGLKIVQDLIEYVENNKNIVFPLVNFSSHAEIRVGINDEVEMIVDYLSPGQLNGPYSGHLKIALTACSNYLMKEFYQTCYSNALQVRKPRAFDILSLVLAPSSDHLLSLPDHQRMPKAKIREEVYALFEYFIDFIKAHLKREEDLGGKAVSPFVESLLKKTQAYLHALIANMEYSSSVSDLAWRIQDEKLILYRLQIENLSKAEWYYVLGEIVTKALMMNMGKAYYASEKDEKSSWLRDFVEEERRLPLLSLFYHKSLEGCFKEIERKAAPGHQVDCLKRFMDKCFWGGNRPGYDDFERDIGRILESRDCEVVKVDEKIINDLLYSSHLNDEACERAIEELLKEEKNKKELEAPRFLLADFKDAIRSLIRALDSYAGRVTDSVEIEEYPKIGIATKIKEDKEEENWMGEKKEKRPRTFCSFAQGCPNFVEVETLEDVQRELAQHTKNTKAHSEDCHCMYHPVDEEKEFFTIILPKIKNISKKGYFSFLKSFFSVLNKAMESAYIACMVQSIYIQRGSKVDDLPPLSSVCEKFTEHFSKNAEKNPYENPAIEFVECIKKLLSLHTTNIESGEIGTLYKNKKGKILCFTGLAEDARRLKDLTKVKEMLSDKESSLRFFEPKEVACGMYKHIVRKWQALVLSRFAKKEEKKKSSDGCTIF